MPEARMLLMAGLMLSDRHAGAEDQMKGMEDKIAQQEAERKAEEERLRKMQQDDAGVRALKQMMNNTLEEKKEHKLVEELVERSG